MVIASLNTAEGKLLAESVRKEHSQIYFPRIRFQKLLADRLMETYCCSRSTAADAVKKWSTENPEYKKE